MTDRRWPPVIHSRGYDAYLCGVQILAGGDETPIYRFPGGQSLVDDSELKKPAEKFHNLMSIAWLEPRDLREKPGLFRRLSVDCPPCNEECVPPAWAGPVHPLPDGHRRMGRPLRYQSGL